MTIGTAITTSLEELREAAQLDLDDAQYYLAQAQGEQPGIGIPQGRESSMLKGKMIQKSIAMFEKLKEHYADALAEKGGIDAAIKEFEKYIVNEKLRDARFASSKELRKCSRDDFQLNQDGSIIQDLDNLNDRGRAKTALRAIKGGETSGFSGSFGEGSNVTIGPEFGGLRHSAREVLAYMWLAASDPELSDDAIRETGSRENCIKEEKDRLINVIAEIQRAHNDSIGSFDAAIDQPSCGPGTWGRLLTTASVHNERTKLKQEESANQLLTSPGERLGLDVKAKIRQRIKELPAHEKVELVNNFNAATIFLTDPGDLIGFGIKDLSKSIEKDFNKNFEDYWDELVTTDTTLSELFRRASQESLQWNGQHYITVGPYNDALASHKSYYKNLWKIEIATLALGIINPNDYYLPLEKDLLDKVVKPSTEKANQELEPLVTQEKKHLEELNTKLAVVRHKIENFPELQPQNDISTLLAYEAEIDKITQEYTSLIAEKNALITRIENKGKRFAMRDFLEKSPLLKMMKEPKEIDGYVDAVAPDVQKLIAEKKHDVTEEKGKEKEETIQEPEMSAINTSDLPEPIRDITMEAVIQHPEYASWFEAFEDDELTQIQIVSLMLKDKKIDDESERNRLATLWVEHHKPRVEETSALVEDAIPTRDTSGLPQEIREITMEEVKKHESYQHWLKLFDNDYELAQKRIVDIMLTDKISNQFKRSELAKQWVDFHKPPSEAVKKDDVSSKEAAIIAPVISEEKSIEPKLPPLQIRERFDAAYKDIANINKDRTQEELFTLTLDYLGFKEENVVDPLKKGYIAWFKNKDELLRKELNDLPNKVRYTERENEYFKIIDEIYHNPQRTTKSALAMMREAETQFIFENAIEKEELSNLGYSRVLFQAGMKRVLDADSNKKYEGIRFLGEAANAGSLDAKHALLVLNKYDDRVQQYFRYTPSLDNFKKETANSVEKFDLAEMKVMETKSLEAYYDKVALSSAQSLPTYNAVEQYYLESIKKVYDNYPKNAGEKNSFNIHRLALNDTKAHLGQNYPVEEGLDSHLMDLGVRKFYFLDGQRIVSGSQPTAKALAEGLQSLSTAADEGDIEAKNLLYSQNVSKYLLELEKDVLNAKVRLLSTSPLDKEEYMAAAKVYSEALVLAAEAGCEQARLTIAQLALKIETTTPGLENVESEAYKLLQTDAKNAFFVTPAINILRDFATHGRDPEIQAIAKNSLQQCANSNYLEHVKLHTQDRRSIPLQRAAKLNHPLAQLEVLNRLSSKGVEEYEYVFKEIPMKHIGDFELIDYEKIYHQAQAIAKLVIPKSPTADKILNDLKDKMLAQLKSDIALHCSAAQSLISQGDELAAQKHIEEGKHKIEQIKSAGKIIEFDLTLHLLEGFKNTISNINPPWLIALKAGFEDNELSIRLTGGAIRYGIQQQRNDKILSQVKQFVNSNPFDNLNNLIDKHEQAEKRYYKLLGKEQFQKKDSQDRIEEIMQKRDAIATELKTLSDNFIESFDEFELSEEDKEYILNLFTDYEKVSLLSESQLEDPLVNTLQDAVERIKRSDLIKARHDNKSNILEIARVELPLLIQEYRTQIRKAKNQVAESIEPGKPSRAQKQFDRLCEAETELNKLQREFLDSIHVDTPEKPKPYKGMQSYQELARKVGSLSENLDKDLKEIGSLKRISKATNQLKNGLNYFLRKLGIEHQFRINTALSSKQKTVLKQDISNLGAKMVSLTEADTKTKPHVEIRRKEGVLFAQHHRKTQENALNYPPEDLELARKFINANLNLSELQATPQGCTEAEFKEYLKSGIHAEIKQARSEPIILEFKSLDGSKKPILAEVSQYTFDQYIEKQKVKNTEHEQQQPSPNRLRGS